MWDIGIGIPKILVRIANRDDPGQTASSEAGVLCLFKPFPQATNVLNYRTFTVMFHVYKVFSASVERSRTLGSSTLTHINAMK